MKKVIILLYIFVLSLYSFSQENLTINKLNTKSIYIGRIDGDKEPNSYWSSVSRIEYQGHNLVIGTPKGNYSHNLLLLKPGGSSKGEIYSGIEVFRAIDENKHLKVIRLAGEKGSDNYINNEGKFGIGTTAPQAMLDVRGKIIADEVQVKVNKGADFVFGSEYNLKPLSEVNTYIKENKHLPEIPSEKEMIENGVNVNELQIKLLQKIEELTLYTIEQQRQLDEQNMQIQKLLKLIKNK